MSVTTMDIMLTSIKKEPTGFSNIDFIPINIKALIEEYGARRLESLTGVKKTTLEKVYYVGECRNVRLCSLERFSAVGVPIGDLMLNPKYKQDVVWYQDSKLCYLGDNIKAFARQKEMSYTIIANYVGVERNTLDRYANGVTYPSQNSLQRIADALEVEVSDLFLAPVEL